MKSKKNNSCGGEVNNLLCIFSLRLLGEFKHLFQKLRVQFITILALAVHDLKSLSNSTHVKKTLLKLPSPVSCYCKVSLFIISDFFFFGMRSCSIFCCYEETTFERRNRFKMSSMVPFKASTWFQQRIVFSGSFSTELCHPVFHILCSEALNLSFLVYLCIFTLMLEYFFLRGY